MMSAARPEGALAKGAKTAKVEGDGRGWPLRLLRLPDGADKNPTLYESPLITLEMRWQKTDYHDCNLQSPAHPT
jgi:hypothetical protein